MEKFIKLVDLNNRIAEAKRAVKIYEKSKGRRDIEFQDVFIMPANVATCMTVYIPYTYSTVIGRVINKNLKATERFDIKGVIL